MSAMAWGEERRSARPGGARATGDAVRASRDSARRGGGTGRRARVLVVDDEAPIVEMLAASLGFAGFEVQGAHTCADARDVAQQWEPELALLDVMLPDGSGFDLCRALRRETPALGVIFVTARDGIDDKLTGLAIGGDDYITKPFSVAEVVARLNGLLRRMESPGLARDEREPALRVADLQLDGDTHRVSRDGEAIELSPTEFRLLRYLLENAGLVLSKPQILAAVWHYDVGGDGQVVEKFISQLRRKIDGPHRTPLLHTVRGFGYALREPAP